MKPDSQLREAAKRFAASAGQVGAYKAYRELADAAIAYALSVAIKEGAKRRAAS